MFDVRISDSLYLQASRAAQAHDVSVDEFIEEVVLLHLLGDEGAPITLTPEQTAVIAKAEADIDAGEYFTADQIRQYFDAKWEASSTGDLA